MKIEAPTELGGAIRAARRNRGMTQRDLALIAGTGERFVVELEAGKATTQLGRTLAVIAALGLTLTIHDSSAAHDSFAVE